MAIQSDEYGFYDTTLGQRVMYAGDGSANLRSPLGWQSLQADPFGNEMWRSYTPSGIGPEGAEYQADIGKWIVPLDVARKQAEAKGITLLGGGNFGQLTGPMDFKDPLSMQPGKAYWADQYGYSHEAVKLPDGSYFITQPGDQQSGTAHLSTTLGADLTQNPYTYNGQQGYIIPATADPNAGASTARDNTRYDTGEDDESLFGGLAKFGLAAAGLYGGVAGLGGLLGGAGAGAAAAAEGAGALGGFDAVGGMSIPGTFGTMSSTAALAPSVAGLGAGLTPGAAGMLAGAGLTGAATGGLGGVVDTLTNSPPTSLLSGSTGSTTPAGAFGPSATPPIGTTGITTPPLNLGGSTTLPAATGAPNMDYTDLFGVGQNSGIYDFLTSPTSDITSWDQLINSPTTNAWDQLSSLGIGGTDLASAASGSLSVTDLITKYGQPVAKALGMTNSDGSINWAKAAAAVGGGLLGGMNGAQQAGTITQTQTPWAAQQPYLQDVFGQAQKAFNTPTPLQNQANSAYSSMLSGPTSNPYLGMNNPYLDDAITNAQNDVTRQMQGQFNTANHQSGSFGNSGLQETYARELPKQLGQISTNMRMQDYGLQAQLGENAANRTQTAVTNANTFANQPLANYSQLVGGKSFGGELSTPYFNNQAGGILGGIATGAGIYNSLFSKPQGS